MPDRSGQTVDVYHLHRQLGESAFAETYLGERHQGQQVVIKLLKSRSVGADFPNWTRIARLKHPHLFELRDWKSQDTLYFYEMPYYPTGSLRALHPVGTKVPLAVVALYLTQLAEALTMLHQEKIFHFNLKPENVLMSAQNTLVLSDPGFGPLITRYVQPIQLAAKWAAYMAPEQFDAQPEISQAIDQYALALMIYEWLCGQHPFPSQHPDYVKLMGQHRTATPVPLRKLEPTIPPSIEQIVLKALAKKPQDRFASVQQFAEAFQQAAPEELDTMLADPAQAKISLPKPEIQHMLLERFQSSPTWEYEAVEKVHALSRQAQRDPELAAALVALGTAVAAEARQATPHLRPSEATNWLNLLMALGAAADQLRSSPARPGESPWPPALQEQLQAAGGLLWATRANAEKILGFLRNSPSEFALDAVVEMLLGERAMFKEAQALLGRIHTLKIGDPSQPDLEQPRARLLERVRDEAARRLAGALAPGGQEARIHEFVQLLEIVAPPTSSTDLWHALYEQQPRPTHLSWNARAWLVSHWMQIAERFAGDDLRAWLRVDWSQVSYLLAMGLPEAWQEQALQMLLATQPIPAGLFPMLAQQGYQDKVPLLARLLASTSRAPKVAERLLQEASLSPEEAKTFIEAYSEPVLKVQPLPPTFVKLVEGYLAGLNERDAARLLKVGYMPLKALGAYAQQQAGSAGAPLLAALEQVGARAGKRAAEVLADWNRPRGSGSLDVQQVVWFWLNLMDMASTATGQTGWWLNLLQQVPQPRAEVPITIRLHLLSWWAQARKRLKGPERKQLDEQVLGWLKISWKEVDEVVQWGQPGADGKRPIPDEWYTLMLLSVAEGQRKPLTGEEIEVLERHGESQFGRLLVTLFYRPEYQEKALRFWGYVVDSSYSRKTYLFFSLLWMAQRDRALAQQLVEGAKEKLDQREKDEFITIFLPAFRRPEVAEGFADWLEEPIKNLPVRVGKIAAFLGRGRPAQPAEQAQAQPPAPAPRQAGAQAASPPPQAAPSGGQPAAQPPAQAASGTPGKASGQFMRDTQGNLYLIDENGLLVPQPSSLTPQPPSLTPPAAPAYVPGGASPVSGGVPASSTGKLPAYVPGKRAIEIPARIEVPKPAAPIKFVKDFLNLPKTQPIYLAYLVAALEDIPQRERDPRWSDRITRAIGGAAATEEELEYALVYLAPALGMAPLAFLAECAKTAATKFKLEDLPYHLMSYVHLAVKYAYADNQPPETQAPAIMLVLHALNLTLASIKDSEKQRIRRLRMLTIIHNNYTKWPDANLRDLWTWYQQTYFPASQYPLMPHL